MMSNPTPNDNDNDNDNDHNNDNSNSNSNAVLLKDQRRHIQKVDCVIIGAGAAGLQCAANLLEHRSSLSPSLSSSSSSNNNDNNPDNNHNNGGGGNNISVVVLEARDRVGGRIFTTRVKTMTVGLNEAEVLLHRDHGASWVHGTHKSNPMMQLLAETESESAAELITTLTEQPLQVLTPVFEGNPWVRPHTVLHRNGNKGGNSIISLFVNGSIVSDNMDSNGKTEKGDSNSREDVDNELIEAPTSSPSPPSSVSRAIGQHYQVLREIVSQYNNDEVDEDDENNNVDQLYQQLSSVLDAVTVTENEEDEKRLISLLAPFYLYLMENWNGISMKDTKVNQIVDLLVPEQEDSNHDEGGGTNYYEKNKEENKENKSEIAMAETDEHYVSAGDFSGPHCKVKTGMFTVLEPLIKIIEHHHHTRGHQIIRPNEEVVSIVDKHNHVRVEMASGMIVEAKCCVSTIPLGCLQKSTPMSTSTSPATTKSLFQPRLCHDKIEAIHSIWSGSYKKVFLTFDHIFWPKQTPMIGLVRTELEQHIDGSTSCVLPGRHLLFYNLWARDNIPCIEAILCGDLGKWAFRKSDENIQEAVIEFLEASMGLCNLSASCIGCHVTRWEEDEFTMGSYSAFNLGTLDRHVDALGSTEWDGRLVFAGEATENDHMGSVHGALISGKRAATEVLDLLATA